MKVTIAVTLLSVVAYCASATAQSAQISPGSNARAVVDSSSDATFEASLASIKATLPEASRQKFDQAVMILMASVLEGGEQTGVDASKLLRAKLDGVAGQKSIRQAESFVSKILEDERARKAKTTDALLPGPPPIRSNSWACEAILSTSIKPAEPRDADVFQLSNDSLVKPRHEGAELPKRLDASSAAGTDKLAVEIKGDVLRVLTRTSVELGETSAAEFEILDVSSDYLFAVDFERGLLGGTLSSFVINRRLGLAVWTKSRPEFLIVPEPDTQSYYLKCR